MNFESQPLQPHEITAIKADPRALQRLLASYRLMLDFYGMRLVSEETGAVDRALPPRNYASRYENLVRELWPYLLGDETHVGHQAPATTTSASRVSSSVFLSLVLNG